MSYECIIVALTTHLFECSEPGFRGQKVTKVHYQYTEVETNTLGWLMESLRELEVIQQSIFVQISTLHQVPYLLPTLLSWQPYEETNLLKFYTFS